MHINIYFIAPYISKNDMLNCFSCDKITSGDDLLLLYVQRLSIIISYIVKISNVVCTKLFLPNIDVS